MTCIEESSSEKRYEHGFHNHIFFFSRLCERYVRKFLIIFTNHVSVFSNIVTLMPFFF